MTSHFPQVVSASGSGGASNNSFAMAASAGANPNASGGGGGGAGGVTVAYSTAPPPWNIRLDIIKDESHVSNDVAAMTVRFVTNDNITATGYGSAKRSPQDEPDSQIGMHLALGRALQVLAAQLIDGAEQRTTLADKRRRQRKENARSMQRQAERIQAAERRRFADEEALKAADLERETTRIEIQRSIDERKITFDRDSWFEKLLFVAGIEAPPAAFVDPIPTMEPRPLSSLLNADPPDDPPAIDLTNAKAPAKKATKKASAKKAAKKRG